MEETSNGIKYEWYLAGPNGASFILHTEAHHTKEDIAQAKAEIRRNQDVVSLRIANDDDRDNEYKKQYFRYAKALPWYHIFDDEKVIRRERKKGTTPEQFYQRFVLPNVEALKAETPTDPFYKKPTY